MIDLFSVAHLDSARIVLLGKINDPLWLKKIWTEDEINKCKEYEYRKFIKFKELEHFPNKKEYLKLSKGKKFGYVIR